ncbi:MAG: beta-galactosidase/beta-glucuronidase, partial [Psychroserpens sp.]
MKQLLYILGVCLFIACKNDAKKTESDQPIGDGPAKVEVSKSGDKYQLLVNGEPFYIKGAGLEFGNVAALAEHNANSFRTWRTDNGKKSAKEVLDEAQKYGLMVSMGLEVERERHGFDYDDEEAVQEQMERIKMEV